MIYTEAPTLQEQFQEHINNSFIIFVNFGKKNILAWSVTVRKKSQKTLHFQKMILRFVNDCIFSNRLANAKHLLNDY